MNTLSAEGLTQIMFATASASADWRLTYRLAGMSGWDATRDEVVIGLSPDFMAWDDYGYRSRGFPAGRNDYPPGFQASSNDGTGVVVLVDPDVVDILIPYNSMRQLGPGTLNVELQYRQDTGSRATLLLGRLPLQGGQF